MNGEADIRVRFDATGGGVTVYVDGSPETYTYSFGNAVSWYGMLALLGGESDVDGGEEIYRERLRAELLARIDKHGVRSALQQVFDITLGEN